MPALHHTHHELLMPKFDHLTKTERRSIALYVISLRNDGDDGRVHNEKKHSSALAGGCSCGLFVGLIFSNALGAQNADVVAHDAWARVPEIQDGHGAVHGGRKSHGSVKSDRIRVHRRRSVAEMHQMTMIKMMMVMTPVSQISIPAKGKTSFDPNGFHIMLFGLKTRPEVGDKIT